jgi:hypothetical protein
VAAELLLLVELVIQADQAVVVVVITLVQTLLVEQEHLVKVTMVVLVFLQVKEVLVVAVVQVR